MKIKGAIFDMDGTLVDSLFYWPILWEILGERYLQNHDFRPDADVDKTVRTLPLKEAMFLIHETYQIGRTGQEVYETADELLRDFYQNRVSLKPGAESFLKWCISHKIPMCVASASETKSVRMSLRRCGLDKYISDVFSCVEVGKGKEYPDVYLKALEFLGTLPEETWVFEDSSTALLTAKEIGLKTVGVFDANNYGQDILEQHGTQYIAEGETLEKLISVFENS